MTIMLMPDSEVIDAMEDTYCGLRLFDSIYDLIGQLGCKIRYADTLRRRDGLTKLNTIGSPPQPRASLCVNAEIAVDDRSLDTLSWAAHEAMHHFFDPGILDDDETEMMVLEWVFYNAVSKRGDRRELLLNLTGSYVAGGTIGGLVQEYKGSQFFYGAVWGDMVEQTVRRGWIDWDMNVSDQWLEKLKN